MLVKVYIHPRKLINIENKEPVLAKQMTSSQYDIEMLIDTDKYFIMYQSNGVLISKRSIMSRIKRWFKRG